jgi:hypothetical protein
VAALAPTLPVPRLARKRDDELVARVRRGDEGAFAELYERHRPALVRYARRILGDRGWVGLLPEDVVQEVFVKAHAAQYVVGTVFRDQPVVVKKKDHSGKWARVVTDAGVKGWVRAKVVSRGPRCAS